MTTFNRFLRGAAVGAALALSLLAQAHGGKAGDIEITHPYATPTPPGAVNGAAYMTALVNHGKETDRLVSASSPVAQRAEIHQMSVDGGIMRMRQVPGVELVRDGMVRMAPGDGYHIMLIGLKQPLRVGDSFPLTLQFEHNGSTEVKVVVQAPKAAGAMSTSTEGHQH